LPGGAYRHIADLAGEVVPELLLDRRPMLERSSPILADLEAESQPEPEHAFVHALAARVASAGHLEYAAAETAVRVQPQVRDGAAGVAEMRCIRQVKRLGAELEVEPLRHLELTEQAKIQVDQSGTSQNVEAGSAKTRFCHRRKRSPVVKCLPRTDS